MNEVANIRSDLASATLDELAAMAAEEYRSYGHLMVGALGRFVKLGQVLLAARPRIQSGGGEWREWCDGIGIDPASVSNSMRLAQYADQLPESVFEPWVGDDGKIRSPSINRALTYVRGLPAVNQRGWSPYDGQIKAEAVRLVGQGVPPAEVAAILGATRQSIKNWTEPGAQKAYERSLRANAARRRRQRAAADREQRKSEMAAAAKAASSDLSSVYALLRRTISATEKARSKADTSAAESLAAAIRQLHAAEESVVAAMRAEVHANSQVSGGAA